MSALFLKNCYDKKLKKLFTYLFLIFFSFSASSYADDISDFQIEGISIGDSLLDYFSEKEIKEQIKKHKYIYQYTTDEFGEVYKFEGLETYQMLSFFVKPDDNNFTIYAIFGTLPHEKDMNSCYKKMSEISKEFSVKFKDTEKRSGTNTHAVDTTGRSTAKEVNFRFKSGDAIRIICTDFEESLRIEKGWIDGLDIAIQSKEVSDWLRKRIN